MKTLILLSIALVSALVLSGCGPAQATTGEREHPPENGAQFKKGAGVSLTETMKNAIGLKTVEVGETKIAPAFTVALSSTANEISGWLTAEQAALVKPGMEVELDIAGTPGTRGAVKRVDKAPYATLGDFEVTVETAAPLETGVRVQATFRGAPGEAVTSVPRAALLKTAEGNFVYAVNGEFYVRTPVKIGAVGEAEAEITDGLYSGDQIVVSPVMSLWLAELQVLRGGKACSCGAD